MLQRMGFGSQSALTRRTFLSLCGLLCLGGTARAEESKPAATPSPPRLVILPLGAELTDEGLDFVRRSLEAFYDFRVDVLPRQALPKSTFYAPRKRYRADKLLDYLETQAPADAARIVGLTAVDISTTKGKVFDWGILGLATIDGRLGVLSSFRCRRGTRTAEEALVRFGKVAVHEVGHTLGLEHCPTLACLMEDAKGTVMTTDREYDLCPNCRKRLQTLGRQARSSPSIPWPKPGS
jgi:archaemetzincin